MREPQTARPTLATEAADGATATEREARLRRFQQDAEYFDAHYEELQARYAERWIAIYHGEVVGAAPQLDDLLTAIMERGIPAGQALVEFVTDREDVLIV